MAIDPSRQRLAEGQQVADRSRNVGFAVIAREQFVRRARRRVVRILGGWPGADALLNANKRIAPLT